MIKHWKNSWIYEEKKNSSITNFAENFCLYQDTNVVDDWKIMYFVYFKVFL